MNRFYLNRPKISAFKSIILIRIGPDGNNARFHTQGEECNHLLSICMTYTIKIIIITAVNHDDYLTKNTFHSPVSQKVISLTETNESDLNFALKRQDSFHSVAMSARDICFLN